MTDTTTEVLAAAKTATMSTSTTTAYTTATLDHLLLQTVSEHPFTVSGGAILKIIKKLRGK
jgi:hypothetical protein